MRIRVNTATPYDVIVGENILRTLGGEFKSAVGGGRVLIVSDDGVPGHIRQEVGIALNAANIEYSTYIFPNGESSKNFGTLLNILTFLAQNGYTREDAVFAVGGGVVGDMAGLAAALYMRGIKYVQIPTTLLAAIDSSVGGKTAVDLPEGKNLVGAFHQPSLVAVDAECFRSLSVQNMQCGLGEGVKYGLLNGELWEEIKDFKLIGSALYREKNGKLLPVDLAAFAAECVKIKADIVSRDEREGGIRKYLNLGHTVGHAVELLAGYTLPHGVCVAKGLVKILSMPSCGCGAELKCEAEDIFSRLGIDTSINYTKDELLKAMMSDKKRGSSGITFAFVSRPGEPFLKKMTAEEIAGEL